MARYIMNESSRALYLARALYDAVEDCNIQQVNILLTQNKADPNILIPEEGMTTFHLAAGHENVSFGKVAVSLILHNGGNPNVRCEGNRTVLHIAVAWNRSSVVELLLKNPFIIPNPYLKDDDNLNVLNYAMKFAAWESLATLQSFIKQLNDTRNSKTQAGKKMQSKILKEELKLSKSVETTVNISDKLHTSSGYFNSGESLDSTPESTKCDSITQKNLSPNESILLTSTTESLSDISSKKTSEPKKCDSHTQQNHSSNESILLTSSSDSLSGILNKNISSDVDYTGLFDDIPSNIISDLSSESSMTSINDNFENLENISFPSSELITDSELFKIDEIELTTDNMPSLPKDVQSNNSEWMTDISGISSFMGSDDYFTCPDNNSEKRILNRKIDKTDIQFGDLTNNKSLASLYESMSNSISKISIEKNNLESADNNIISSDESSSSLTEVTKDYDTDYLRQSLREYGYPPGPLVPSTKQLYVRKLNRIIKNQDEPLHDNKYINIPIEGSYSMQLNKVLTADKYDSWKKTIKSWSVLEEEITCRKNGSSFTYLLLDPRITKNLPARADLIKNPIEVWQTFISSIFYIGKGTKSRPTDHMNEAFNSWIKKTDKEMNAKTEYILSLWKERLGVVSVQAFHHLEQKEAHIREAAMIDAIGLDRLTNEKRGTYYDNTIRWRHSDRCKLGCHILYRAMLVFLADGERQLRPIDLT